MAKSKAEEKPAAPDSSHVVNVLTVMDGTVFAPLRGNPVGKIGVSATLRVKEDLIDLYQGHVEMVAALGNIQSYPSRTKPVFADGYWTTTYSSTKAFKGD